MFKFLPFLYTKDRLKNKQESNYHKHDSIISEKELNPKKKKKTGGLYRLCFGNQLSMKWLSAFKVAVRTDEHFFIDCYYFLSSMGILQV